MPRKRIRFVKSYERFTSDEFDARDVELEYVPPNADEPAEDEAAEPWNLDGSKPELSRCKTGVLLAYRAFLER